MDQHHDEKGVGLDSPVRSSLVVAARSHSRLKVIRLGLGQEAIGASHANWAQYQSAWHLVLDYLATDAGKPSDTTLLIALPTVRDAGSTTAVTGSESSPSPALSASC